MLWIRPSTADGDDDMPPPYITLRPHKRYFCPNMKSRKQRSSSHMVLQTNMEVCKYLGSTKESGSLLSSVDQCRAPSPSCQSHGETSPTWWSWAGVDQRDNPESNHCTLAVLSSPLSQPPSTSGNMSTTTDPATHASPLILRVCLLRPPSGTPRPTSLGGERPAVR